LLKDVKCYISAAVWPILIKFGMTVHIRPSNLKGNKKSEFENPRLRTSVTFKIIKSQYLKNRFYYFDYILPDNTY